MSISPDKLVMKLQGDCFADFSSAVDLKRNAGVRYFDQKAPVHVVKRREEAKLILSRDSDLINTAASAR